MEDNIVADNIVMDAGSGGSTVRTDDDGTAHWQYVKMAYGADNTQTIVTSTTTNPFPVALSDTDNAVLDTIDAVLDLINAKLVSGTVIGDVNLGATDNAVLDTIDGVLDTINAKLVTGTVIGDVNLGATDNAVLDSIVTAVEIIDNGIYVDDADWTATTSSHSLIGGIYQSTPGSITDGDTGPLRLDANGAVHINDGGNSITVDNADITSIKTAVELIDNAISGSEMQVDIVTSALPSGASTEATLASVQTAVEILDDWDETNRAAVNLVASQAGVVGGTGVDAANALRVSLATDIPLPAGTAAIGKLAANAGVDIGDVTTIPKTSGGLSFYKTIDLDESEEEVKATAGQVYGLFFTNSNAAVRYLKVYNATAATVVVGTTVPDLTFAIPPDDGGLFLKFEMGLAFGTAITIAATTAVADADAGAPGANEVIGAVFYK